MDAATVATLTTCALRLLAVAFAGSGVLFYAVGASLLGEAPVKALATCALGALAFGAALLVVTL